MKKFNNYLKKNKIKYTVVAQRLNINPVTVWHWARGTSIPNIPNGYKLEKMTRGKIKMQDWI